MFVIDITDLIEDETPQNFNFITYKLSVLNESVRLDKAGRVCQNKAVIFPLLLSHTDGECLLVTTTTNGIARYLFVSPLAVNVHFITTKRQHVGIKCSLTENVYAKHLYTNCISLTWFCFPLLHTCINCPLPTMAFGGISNFTYRIVYDYNSIRLMNFAFPRIPEICL